MLRDLVTQLSDWAFERTLDLNVVSSFGKAGYVMRSRYFDAHALDVDATGLVCLVTGANAGLGYATVSGLARRGATVYLLCRNQERGESARAALAEETGSRALHLELVDLAEPASIRDFVARWGERRVDVLVQNAGVLPESRIENSEGVELTWATNLVGPYLLTKLLIPCLSQSASSRVIFVSSGGMYLKKLDLDDWASTRGSFDGTVAYANTKRALVVLAREWAPRLSSRRIALNSMHPGWVDTASVRASLPRFYRMTKSILRDWQQGADSIIWLALSAEAGALRGQFVFDREPRKIHLTPLTRESAADRQKLLDLLAEQTGEELV